jgi:cytochrome b561
MPWVNTSRGYGDLTKLCHWLIVALFAFQFAVASVMLRLGPKDVVLGMTQAGTYNWHKSMGLVALLVAIVRLWARHQGELPPWAPVLSTGERAFVHRAEQGLYAAMFLMPVSGFVYVMAGGYGVHLFGIYQLPNPLPAWTALAIAAKWVHIASGWALAAALAGHIGLVLRHHLILRDGLLRRMLPAPSKALIETPIEKPGPLR